MSRKKKNSQIEELTRLLTIEGAAARRGVSAATIWRRVALNQISTHRVLGRVVLDIADVDALVLVPGGGRRGAK